ncbi:hypothetical protein [Nonomuraea diastatica]|uniref:Integral membrane protein n=1 Tax=Nonomuraea diastatica TaxID=1848329 RepID=A0A4R4VPH8_9ACTN|nr:hypothetical protein [Nonomuraea diastatica]TDD02000.1 hypothetical protein E1294_51420 [Nonomuraea diastatica]
MTTTPTTPTPTVPADGEVTTGAVLLAEYDAIKREQAARTGLRDNLLYATLTASAAIAALTATADRTELLTLLPLACLVLGWTYLMNDHAISAIGRYVRTDLQPRLTGLLATPTPLFGWEHAHRRDRRRLSRKRLQLGADLTAFCLPPLAALTVLWTTGPHPPAVLAISLAELAAVAVLATQIIRYADLTHPTSPERAQ